MLKTYSVYDCSSTDFPLMARYRDFMPKENRLYPKLVVRIFTDMICLLDKLDAVLSKAQLSTSNEESLQSANKRMEDQQATIVFIYNNQQAI